MRGHYFSFVVYFVYTLLGALFLEMWLAVLTFIVVAEFDIKDMSPDSVNFPFLMAALLMIIFLGVALKMLSYWQQSKMEYQQLMHDKLEAELRFLKTQLNPHFLFNTLNNLYYLSIEKSEQTPKAILALSEMLDYVLHDGKSMLIPFAQEIKQLRNYISLERLRYEDRLQIEVKTEGDMESPRVAPMMLITLVENAFKHGAMKTAEKAWIKIEVVNTTAEIRITVRNSWKKNLLNTGIGLANVKDQLKILFPDKHTLLIDDSSDDEFKVVLTLRQAS
jgi:LytS/YehU family sensor histidine kinase